MRANFFIVESPLQASSAIKVSNIIGGVSWFIVRLNGEVKNDKLIKQVFINKNDINNVYFVKCSKNNKKDILKALLKCYFFCLSKNIFGSKVFIGHWQSIWMRILAYFISARCVNVLDDGLATLSALKILESSLNNGVFYKYKLGYYPTFFSSFANESSYPKVFKLPHSEERIKKIEKGFAIIIGSPLTEKKILSEHNYEFYIDYIISYIDGRFSKVLYIPHRSENSFPQKLSLVKNIAIKKIDTTVEEFLDGLDFLPCTVISFYSTALVNICNEYNGIRCISIVIRSNDINVKFKERVNEAYNYFSKNKKIEMIEI